jgi:glucosylceramidase
MFEKTVAKSLPMLLMAGMIPSCGGAGSTGSSPPPPATGPAVAVVLTTDDQTKLMQSQPDLNFSSAGGSNPIYVDETQTYQTVEGFGASFTDSAAYLLNEVVPTAARNKAMHDLFTRSGNGIGLSFMRIPMGAADLARNLYSYDDLPAGQTDPTLANFSIAHDQADIIPLIQQAKQLNPHLILMANPWSPPGWMKDSGSMVGGSLLPSMYRAFAGYFVKFVQAYRAAGIPIDYISLQNEPLYLPKDYAGMCMPASPGGVCDNRTWSSDQTSALRDYVLPAFQANNISAKVLVYDHNWDRPDFPDAVLSDPALAASSQVAGIAWHGYGGTAGAMSTLYNKYPGKGNYQTEHSGGTWVKDQVKSDFEEITQVMRNWGRAYVKWSLALDENRGPHSGGCGTCSPLVTVNSKSGAIIYFVDYYTLGHFSRFVQPGANRVYSSNSTGVVTAAFVNPDGSKALVAYNDSTAAQAFTLQWGTQSVSYTLAAGAGATFHWSGAQSGSYKLDAKSQIQASSYSTAAGLQTELTSDANGGYDLGYAADGGTALYKNVDFGTGVSGVRARVASGGNGGTLEFRLDSPSGTLIGSVSIPVTGGWQNWQTVSGAVSGASGLHELYVVFKEVPGKGTPAIGNLNWFAFQ